MYRPLLPLVNVGPHADASSLITSPNEIISTLKNPREPEKPVDCKADTSATVGLSLASSSKFVKELRHRGGNNGWNSYSSLLFFLYNFFLVCATCRSTDLENCAVGIRTPGTTWPRGDIILEHGQPLKIYCMLDENSRDPRLRDRNASDLRFFRGNTLVNPEHITIVNKTTIMMYVDHPPPLKNMYYCKLKLSEGHIEPYAVVCLNQVVIGFKPEEPENFSCISYNWEKLVCTWKPAPNYVTTHFSLRFSLSGRYSRTVFPCPIIQEERELSPNTCLWDISTNPPYRQIYEYYTFELNVENALGTNSFNYTFHHYAHVIPSKPLDLSVQNKTSSSVLLHWRIPYAIINFPPGLHHRISYQNQRDSQNSWETIDITNKIHSTEMYFDLTNLQHANSVYRVRVFMKSSVAVGEDRWSQFSEITFKTAPALPGLPPKTDIGSFETSGNNCTRDVYIYWKAIPAEIQNGDDFKYQIVRVEENDRKLDLQPDEITNTYAKFTGISLNSFKFEIAAANCKGVYNQLATVHVPSPLEMPQKPVVFTKIAFGKGVYELSWDPPTDANITNYTIFWCENDRNQPYQCSGNLDWVHVPRSTNMYNTTVLDPEKIYRFAIAANTDQTSSGMVWFSGITTLSPVVGKIDSLWLNRVESNMIEVGWNLEYSLRIGIVEGFNLYYCPILSPSELACNGRKMNKTMRTDRHTTHGVLDGLQPSTTYMLTVAVLSKNGEGPQSDSIYFTTLEYSLALKSMPKISIGESNELDFDATDCITHANKLLLTISKLQKTIEYLLHANHQLRESALKCNEAW